MAKSEFSHPPYEKSSPAHLTLAEIPLNVRSNLLQQGYADWLNAYNQQELLSQIGLKKDGRSQIRSIRSIGKNYSIMQSYFGDSHMVPAKHWKLVKRLGRAVDCLAYSDKLSRRFAKKVSKTVKNYVPPDPPQPANDESYRQFLREKGQKTADLMAHAATLQFGGQDIPIRLFHELRQTLCQITYIYSLLEDRRFISLYGDLATGMGNHHDNVIVKCSGYGKRYDRSGVKIDAEGIGRLQQAFLYAFGENFWIV